LPELIDLAQRNNPETRVAWERARMAAAGVGLSESLYYPYLVASAGAGYERAFIPFPTLAVDLRPVAPTLAANPQASLHSLETQKQPLPNVSIVGGGSLITDAVASRVAMSVKWLLLDFGERKAGVDASRERLMMANVGFNATHQKVVFEVTQRFYALSDCPPKGDRRQVRLFMPRKPLSNPRVRVSRTGWPPNRSCSRPQQQDGRSSNLNSKPPSAPKATRKSRSSNRWASRPPATSEVADIAGLPLPSPPDRSVDALIDAGPCAASRI